MDAAIDDEEGDSSFMLLLDVVDFLLSRFDLAFISIAGLGTGVDIADCEEVGASSWLLISFDSLFGGSIVDWVMSRVA